MLAAGASRRLGRSKARVLVPSAFASGAGSETLIHRATRAATMALKLSAGPDLTANRGNVVVVIPPHDEDLAASIQGLGATALVNEAASEGMAASIRKGIAHLSALEIDVALLLTIDQPLVTPRELAALVSAVAEGSSSVAAAAYAGKLGVPAAFASSWFSALLALEGDRGARELLAVASANEGEVCSIPMPHAARDLDTEEAVDALLADPEARAALLVW